MFLCERVAGLLDGEHETVRVTARWALGLSGKCCQQTQRSSTLDKTVVDYLMKKSDFPNIGNIQRRASETTCSAWVTFGPTTQET